MLTINKWQSIGYLVVIFLIKCIRIQTTIFVRLAITLIHQNIKILFIRSWLLCFHFKVGSNIPIFF